MALGLRAATSLETLSGAGRRFRCPGCEGSVPRPPTGLRTRTFLQGGGVDPKAPSSELESRPRVVHEADEDIPLIAFLNVILRYRRVVLLATVASVAATVAAGLLFGGYRAQAVFAPVMGTQSPLGDVASLAAKFGINVAGAVGSPVGFYADLPTTDGLLSQLAETRFSFVADANGRDTLSGTLVALLKARGDTPEELLQDAVDHLQRKIDVTSDLGAGTVTVKAVAPWPALAEKMTRRILDLVNVFNVEVGCHVRGIDLRANTLKLGQVVIQGENGFN